MIVVGGEGSCKKPHSITHISKMYYSLGFRICLFAIVFNLKSNKTTHRKYFSEYRLRYFKGGDMSPDYPLYFLLFFIFLYFLQYLKLVLSKGPDRVGVFLSSPEDGSSFNFRNVAFSS
jgi:hypothetical protein